MQSFEINPEHVMRDVYSYPFPEVRELLASRQLDPRFMLNTLPVDEAQALLAGYHFTPGLELPARRDGSLDLDELHIPILERISVRLAPVLPGIGDFEQAYPTPGSSQAMFTLMAEWAAKGEMQSLGCLEGEYEGYAAYAESLQLPITRYTELAGNPVKPGEVWFVSNPSALDGNTIAAENWQDFVQTGHQIVYDAAYIGLTTDTQVDVSSSNIRAVLTSPSKNFGVFRYRHTGIVYTREPVRSLYGSKWFKDIPALLDTLSLYETFDTHQIARTYKPAQIAICAALGEAYDTDVIPSDVLLLATAPDATDTRLKIYTRAKTIRLGLTKLFEDYERYSAKA